MLSSHQTPIFMFESYRWWGLGTRLRPLQVEFLFLVLDVSKDNAGGQ